MLDIKDSYYIKPRKKVGLALGGGVVRGLAHLGVLSVFEEAGIPVDYVAGSSAGTIIGAGYCSGLSVEKLRIYALTFHWWKIARPVWPVRGFVSFDKLARWMEREFGDLDFEDLKIPFIAMATDLERAEPVKLDHGKVSIAVQASCSVPGFITPVEWEGRLLGDGALTDTIPISTLREMGADYVIGVDVFTPKLRRFLGPLGYGLVALETLVERAGGGIKNADCMITPALGGKTYFRFSKREELFELGRQAALEKVDCIRSTLGLDPPEDPDGQDAPYLTPVDLSYTDNRRS
jgi:NTE family protein